MRKLFVPPTFAPRQQPVSTTLLNSSVTSSKTSDDSLRLSYYRPNSSRQYISQQPIVKTIRGRELFIRSIRRIIEQIRDKNQHLQNNQQLLLTYEEAISIFNDLTFMKCVVLKKKLLDSNNRTWTIEFARQGGLYALLACVEQLTHKGLSLVDAILVNEILQCLRAMMNINELFEHIATNPQYIDSIAKILNVPSAEIRMRVFELLTALCVYSTGGYELVLRSLQDFQANNKFPNIFVVILEQLKFSVMAKHKWSAIALLNSILSSTESIEKRFSYRNILYSSGIKSILEQARINDDVDLNLQIDIFLEDQKRDEEEFLGNFDSSDNQAVCQAIQLQLASDSNDSALFLTSMQILYSALTSADSNERQKVLKSLLQFISHPREKKIIEKASQTDAVTGFDTKPSSTDQQISNVTTSTSVITSEKSLEKPIDTQSISNESSVTEAVLPPPLLTNIQTTPVIPCPPPPLLPANLQVASSSVSSSHDGVGAPPPPPPLPPPSGFFGGPPPPPPPPPGFFGGPLPPPLPPSFLGGPPPPPPPPGFLGAPQSPMSVQLGSKPSTAGLSVLVDNIPKPTGKVRRLQWKKLTQTILQTSEFWVDVNKNVDNQINFSQLENSFKVNNENSNNAQVTTKAKPTNILPCNRSIAINVFLKKFNFNELQSFVQSIKDSKSNLHSDCLRMLLKTLPSEDEINLVHDHPQEYWALPEKFIHEIGSISYYQFRIQTRILIVEFDEIFNDVKRKLEHIVQIIDFLKVDSTIKQLARSLLSIGDFLNYGSYAGNAFGFRLDILNQLHDVRSTENKNLLSILLENSPGNFKFIDKLKPMLADDIQLKLVKTEYMDWKKQIDSGLKQINSTEDKQIIEQYKPFYEQSNTKLTDILDPLINQCENKEREIMNQFGETDLNEFNYDTCCTIFRQLIEQVEKQIKEQEKRVLSSKMPLNSIKFPSPKPTSTNENINQSSDNNFMDSLMEELKQKKFATVPTRRRRPRLGLFDNDDREQK